MDTTDPQIKFDQAGICNHCKGLLSLLGSKKYTPENAKETLDLTIEKIKQEGKDKKYNCLIGMSGGVDSTYLAYLVKEKFGLKPLALHVDNGWNSKPAVKNIQNTLRKLDIDLYTHVLDWEEFKNLQIAYLKASVIDIEALTDHCVHATLFSVADEYNIAYIIRGFNNATESLIPKRWTFNKNDLPNIVDINNQFGKLPIKTFPTMGLKKLRYYTNKRNIKTFSPLNYMSFDRNEVRKTIIDELDWVDFGSKHQESVFTRFYQGYILPKKFKVDKRRAHLSSMICTNHVTRAEALVELEKPPYEEQMIRQDYEYVIKKFDLTEYEFEEIMNLPIRSHFDYKTDLYSKIIKKYITPTNPLVSLIKKIKN